VEPIQTSAVVTQVEENDGHTDLVYGMVRLEGECLIGMEGAEDAFLDPITVYWKAPRSEMTKVGQSVSVEIRLNQAVIVSVIPNR
jgi:hypothetical protein